MVVEQDEERGKEEKTGAKAARDREMHSLPRGREANANGCKTSGEVAGWQPSAIRVLSLLLFSPSLLQNECSNKWSASNRSAL